MDKIERIVRNVNATMAMEGMPLHSADKERIRECLRGKISFSESINSVIKERRKNQVGK